MDTLSIWVITQNPSDFPGKFVARRHEVSAGISTATTDHHVADSLADVRAVLPGDLTFMTRDISDDPVIVECWL